MKTHLLLIALFLTATLQAADLPTGQKTPEGVACDAVRAYINRDSKAWLATLVRPIYGDEGNKQYADFKKQMADMGKELKKDDLTKPLGEALEKHELEKAKQEMEKLAEKLARKLESCCR